MGLCKYILRRSHNDEIDQRLISQKVSPSLSDAYLHNVNLLMSYRSLNATVAQLENCVFGK